MLICHSFSLIRLLIKLFPFVSDQTFVNKFIDIIFLLENIPFVTLNIVILMNPVFGQEISYSCIMFWIFHVHSPTCKNHNQVCRTPIDLIIFAKEILGSLFSSFTF